VGANEVQTRIHIETRAVASCSSQHQEVVQLCYLKQRDRQRTTKGDGIPAHSEPQTPRSICSGSVKKGCISLVQTLSPDFNILGSMISESQIVSEELLLKQFFLPLRDTMNSQSTPLSIPLLLAWFFYVLLTYQTRIKLYLPQMQIEEWQD
jgi:hypothetical protein